MTGKELLEELQQLSKEELKQPVIATEYRLSLNWQYGRSCKSKTGLMLSELIQQSPVEVILTNNDSYDSGFCCEAKESYHGKHDLAIWLGTDGVTEPDLIAMFLHEQAHAKHYLRRCGCMKMDGHTLAEYHAMRDSTKQIIKLKNKDVIQAQIDYILETCLDDHPCEHSKAARRLCRTKLWGKLLC